MIIPDYKVSKFNGLNTNIKDVKSLKSGWASDILNWISAGKEGDRIELRRGYKLLGLTRETGSGKITGLGVGVRYDGVQIPFFSFGRKIKYYDSVTDDMIEVGSSLLPVGASGEDVWFELYQSLAGSFMYLGSPNSGIWKVPIANPGSAVSQAVTTFRFAVFHVGRSRAFAGQRNGTTPGNNDKTGFYLSYIDKALLSSYTQVTGESYGTGDGSTVTFAHTLAAISAPKTAMYISVTDGVETFIDDRNGNMIGNAGGTGTVNYATGAVSVTFAVAPLNLAAITCAYYHETATTTGILDFSGGAATQGKSFRQDDSGRFMAIFNLNTIEYCLHEFKTYQYTANLTDTESTNLPYRNIGIPYPRAAFQAPEGILLADLSRQNEPKFRRMEVLQGTDSTTVEPLSISDNLDLTPYEFDYCVAFRFGDYEIFCVQEIINGTVNEYNSIMFVRNVLSGAWSKLDYYVSCLAVYNGALIAGDPISNNIYVLFSGYDEDGDIIANHYITEDSDLETENLKNCRRMVMRGLIQTTQRLKVSLSYDNADFVDVYTIEGDGSYVDTGINTDIGGETLGSHVVGGGASDTASPYEVDFPINSPKFTNVRIKLEALDIGYVAVHDYTFKDIRDKGRKRLPIRTV